MDATQVYLDALDNAWSVTLQVTDGLTLDELCKQPAPNANTIGWMVWHTARVEDALVKQLLMGQKQTWLAGGWAGKFGVTKKAAERGLEDTPRQAFAFRPPSRDILLAYASTVRDNTRSYLKTMRAQDLDERIEIKEWGGEVVARASLLNSVLKEAQQHAGQIAYVRGLLRGPEEP